MNIFGKLFKKDPIIGAEYKKIVSVDRIYNSAKILEITNDYFVVKSLFVEDANTNYLKVAIRSHDRTDFRNMVTILSASILKYTGEQGDYVFYTRLSKPFFYKNYKELIKYLHPFIEYEKNILKYIRTD